MRIPEHQHDYSRIDQLLKEVDIPTLTHHLNVITSDLCELFKHLPVGSRNKPMERLSCLIELNNAFKDIVVDEYFAKCNAENQGDES